MFFVACVALAMLGYFAAERRVLDGRDDVPAVVSDASTHDTLAPGSSGTSTRGLAATSESRYAELARRAEAGEREAASDLANLLTQCAGVDANHREVISLTMLLDPETRHFSHGSKEAGTSALRHRLAEAQARLYENRAA